MLVPSNIDTTEGIWVNRYHVSVPHLQSRSIEDVKTRGVRVSGHKRFDAEMSHEIVRCWLTINDMVMKFKQGIDVGIIHRSDVVKIYEAVQLHLIASINRVQHSMNAQPELFEDLIDLDSFAKAIYTVAKYDLKQDSGVTDFMRAINKKNSVIFNGDIFSKAHNQTPLERADRLHGEEYNSHSEFFTDRLAFAQFGRPIKD